MPSLVTAADNSTLLAPVQLQEVKDAVFQLDADSAPGPDGFSGHFYRSAWHIVGDDLLLAVQEFFAGVPVPRSVASTSIVLLPKKESPATF